MRPDIPVAGGNFFRTGMRIGVVCEIANCVQIRSQTRTTAITDVSHVIALIGFRSANAATVRIPLQ